MAAHVTGLAALALENDGSNNNELSRRPGETNLCGVLEIKKYENGENPTAG
jgi:hypothetical protein